jgi:hypothetical protein
VTLHDDLRGDRARVAPVGLDRLAVFGHLWAIAMLSSAVRWISPVADREPAWGYLMLLAASALLLRPRSSLAFLSVALVNLGFVAYKIPYTPNHVLLEGLINVAVVLAAGRVAWMRTRVHSRRSGTGDGGGWALAGTAARDAWLDMFAPAARAGLIVLYIFAVFHKLNWDFFDSQISCAATMLERLADSFTFLPTGPRARLVSVWATIAAEAAIPILLCLRRTRYVGAAIGFAFHLVLAQYPNGGLYAFASVLYAVYLLFLPASFTTGLNRALAALRERLDPAVRPALVRGLTVGGVLLMIAVATALRPDRILTVGLAMWDVWAVVILVLFFAALQWRPMNDAGKGAVSWRTGWGWVWVIPAVAFLNGLSPYLGLKTETSFSMFSNLRTEAGTNHLVVPRTFHLTGYQDDLVRIESSSSSELEPDDETLMAFFEFRRAASRAPGDFSVTYLRNGERRVLSVVDGVSSDAEATEPIPWWQGKLLRFRPVDVEPRQYCRH